MRKPVRSLVFAIAIVAPTALLHAQSSSPAAQQPCSTSPQPQPCTSPANQAAPADRFPFPGETSAPADSAAPAPKTAAPDAPADNKFPFPGETPSAPGPSGSSSSSSSDAPAFPTDDTDTPDPNSPDSAKDKPAAPGGRRLLKRVNPVGTKLQSPAEREAEDLSIARFYIDQGNLQAAYLRTQDAVKIIPDDPDAHCGLAEAALKLNKRDEAIAEFNACLKLDPVEKQARNARRELARLK